MSLLLDLILAPRTALLDWWRAIQARDQQRAQSAGAQFLVFESWQGWSQSEVEVLARLSASPTDDDEEDFELIAAGEGGDGPWLLALTDGLVRALSTISVTDETLEAWHQAVQELTVRPREELAATLTRERAEELKGWALQAAQQDLTFALNPSFG